MATGTGCVRGCVLPKGKQKGAFAHDNPESSAVDFGFTLGFPLGENGILYI